MDAQSEVSVRAWPADVGGMGALVRAHDWSATPLGPIGTWPAELKTIVDLLLSHEFPMIVLWGPELVQIYNDGYGAIMADKHPGGLGRPTREVWPEVWAFNEPIYRRVLNGETVTLTDQLFHLMRRGSGEDTWITLCYSPVRSGAGQIAGVFLTLFDTTARRARETAQARREQRFELLFNAIDEGIHWGEVVPDRNGRPIDILYLDENPAAVRLIGQSFKGRRLRDLHLRGDPSVIEIVGRVAATGTPERTQCHAKALDLWFDLYVLKVPDSGKHDFIYVFQDITERKRAEAALRDSEHRFRSLSEGMPALVWRSSGSGQWTWVSPQWMRFTGQSQEQSLGEGWLDAVHPDDRAVTVRALARARASGTLDIDHRIRKADGAYLWHRTRSAPVLDESGRIVEWLGTTTDVEQLKQLQQHQKVLLTELQHRVRNTLAIIRSIASRTARTSETVEDYAMHLDGRLNAFARTQAVVTRDPSAGIELESLIAEELVAYSAAEGRQVRIKGPPIRLQPKTAEMFGLAMHELATNAIKYGALASPRGRVTVVWHVQPACQPGADGSDAPRLLLEWTETGLKLDPAAPRRRGFGTELIERTLAFQFNAKATLAFERDKLRCTIDLALSDRVLMPAASMGNPDAGEGRGVDSLERMHAIN